MNHYPSRDRIGDSHVDLAHSAIDMHSASDQPGAGQQQVVRALRDLRTLRLAEDEPDSPAYVRDRTPLKKGQITTLALRDEFRRDPALPILIGDDIFICGVRRGVEQGEYVYRRGELLFGPGEPSASIAIDEQSVVFTMAYARNTGIWPRPKSVDPGSSYPKKPEGDGHDWPSVGDDRGTYGGAGHSSSPGAAPDSFTAEGVLKEALITTATWPRRCT